MSITIRDVREHELDSVLALNNAAGSTILPLDSTSVRKFYDEAAYFRVAEAEDHLAGFLIGLRENADYGSDNFLWFRDHYPEFLYIDRIVVARPYRGAGLGRVFYADVTSFAEVRVPLLACEVFLEPRDDIALLFHGTYGFHEVGQQTMANVERRVSLLARDMCSFTYVRETYLANSTTGLPSQPWLAERVHGINTPQARSA
jgi:predicted GNAT superfamily acetyltransferase